MNGDVNPGRARTAGPADEPRPPMLRRPDVRSSPLLADLRGLVVACSHSEISRGLSPLVMNNGSWQIRVPDDSQYWVEMVKCRHACPVKTDACGYVTAIAEGPLRRRVPHRARHQSLRLHLRPRLRRALRGELPPRRSRCPGRHPRPQAIRHGTLRAGNRRLHSLSRRLRPDGCCRPIAATTRRSPWSAPVCRTDRGARPRAARLQGHGLRGQLRARRHADGRRARLPPAPRAGAA